MNKFKLLFILVIAGLFFATPAFSAILFYEDFEDALVLWPTYPADWKRQGSHGTQELTTEQIRYGLKSYKFSLTRLDAEDYREEIALVNSFNNGYYFTIGNEYWIGFSIFLANGYQSPTDASGLIVHYQNPSIADEPPTCDWTEGVRNPIAVIGTRKDNIWTSWIQWSATQCNPIPKVGVSMVVYEYDPFITGQWVDYVINVKWSYSADGFLKIWQDGVLVTDRTGGTCFNDDIGPYLKIGIYSHHLNQDQVITIYYDELRVGDNNSSYAEVAPGGDTPPSVWLPGWDKRIKLTTDHTVIDGPLANFPAYVKISTSSGKTSADVSAIFDEVGNNWQKIAIANDFGTECYIEKVSWNATSENAELWVKLVSVPNSANKDWYLYYDADHVDNTAYIKAVGDAENVWNSNFKMVQHMEDATISTIVDSTSNNNDGTKKAANEPIEAIGQIGKGQNFDGNDYLTILHDASIDFADEDFTLSVRFKTDTTKIRDYIFSKNYGSVGIKWYGINLYVPNQILAGYVDDGTNLSEPHATDDYNDNAWHQVVLQRNTTTNKVIVYIDGVWNADTNDISGSIANTGNLVIGSRADFNVDRFWIGCLDEFRISQGLRAAEWLKAGYYSGKDNFFTFEDENKLVTSFDLGLNTFEVIQ